MLGPTPHRPSGPPIWGAGSLPAALERTGRIFDGWMPNGVDAGQWAQQWSRIKDIAREAGRDPGALTGAMYLTASVDDDVARANQRLDAYLEQYYGQPAAVLRRRQSCYAGPAAGLAEWIGGYVAAGATHLIVRFAGDHERHLDLLADIRTRLA